MWKAQVGLSSCQRLGVGAAAQFSHPPPSLRHWGQRHLGLVNQNICLIKALLQVLIYHHHYISLSSFHHHDALLGPGLPSEVPKSHQGGNLFVLLLGGKEAGG